MSTQQRLESIGSSAHRDERTAAILGIALGIAFGTCFLTGLYSHFAQHPPSWFTLPAAPAGLYRVTQGLHVVTGIASIPLLLAKLYVVYPKLFRWPPFESVAHALERISLVPLVAGALFLLWTGVANIDLWYPLPFFFPAAHYWTAWITIGALIVHIGAKAATTRRAVARRVQEPASERGERRRFLGLAGGASALLALTTVGMTVEPLERLALLAPRRPTTGPQGFPVNGSAVEARVVEAAMSPDYRLEVVGAAIAPMSFRLADLRELPSSHVELPIACVEGWSADVRWRGVRLRDLLDHVGAPAGASVTVRSLENGLYAQSDVNSVQARSADTLLALEANGEPLHIDHGFPVRLIGPNRPGVMQTKWLSRIEVR
jgi:DMSO/TMAO reductase YedYZ molybdopterin-dependent catalytic subunit